jgi:hypothetical protein
MRLLAVHPGSHESTPGWIRMLNEPGLAEGDR